MDLGQFLINNDGKLIDGETKKEIKRKTSYIKKIDSFLEEHLGNFGVWLSGNDQIRKSYYITDLDENFIRLRDMGDGDVDDMKAFGTSLFRISVSVAIFTLISLYAANIFVHKDYNPLNVFKGRDFYEKVYIKK